MQAMLSTNMSGWLKYYSGGMYSLDQLHKYDLLACKSTYFYRNIQSLQAKTYVSAKQNCSLK